MLHERVFQMMRKILLKSRTQILGEWGTKGTLQGSSSFNMQKKMLLEPCNKQMDGAAVRCFLPVRLEGTGTVLKPLPQAPLAFRPAQCTFRNRKKKISV